MSSLPALQALIKDKYGLDATQLDPHAAMLESGIDSLALVEFLFEVEDKFAISLPEDHTRIQSLADLALVVDQLTAAQGASAAQA
jgi:acyl carrier protein